MCGRCGVCGAYKGSAGAVLRFAAVERGGVFRDREAGVTGESLTRPDRTGRLPSRIALAPHPRPASLAKVKSNERHRRERDANTHKTTEETPLERGHS